LQDFLLQDTQDFANAQAAWEQLAAITGASPGTQLDIPTANGDAPQTAHTPAMA